MTKPRKQKPAVEQVADKATKVAENTTVATQQVEDFVSSLPVFTMRKQNNQWFAAIGREEGRNLTSKVGIVRLYNSGHPSVQFVTVEFASVSGDEMLFTISSNLLKK